MNRLERKIIADTKARINRVKRRIVKNTILPRMSGLYIDRNPDYRSTVFLAGTERSGTTWISNIINYGKEYRYIFEPFWGAQVDICRGFREQQYLRPDNRDSYFVETAETVLSGRIRNQWTDKYHGRLIADKRLIKDVRANLFLKWMHVNFPEMPIILLLRHPCAVAKSQFGYRSQHWPPDPEEEFLAQEELMEDFLDPFRVQIEGAQTDFERMIFRWCIQNYVPLKQFEQDEVHLAFYESFCEKPRSELDRLFSFLGKGYDEAVFAALDRPSLESREDSAIISGGSLVDLWREQISDEQVCRAVEILGLFGLDRIYSHGSMPDVDGAHEFMGDKGVASV